MNRRATGIVSAGVAMAAIAVVTIATAVIGFYGLRISPDHERLYVASRTVRPLVECLRDRGEHLRRQFPGRRRLILPRDRRPLVSWTPPDT